MTDIYNNSNLFPDIYNNSNLFPDIYNNSNLFPVTKFKNNSRSTQLNDVLQCNIFFMITKVIPIGARISLPR